MLFFIVTLGNMLGDALQTLKNHWELKKTPCKHHDNFLGMCWEHFMNTKISKKSKLFKNKYLNNPKNKPKSIPT